MLLTTQLPHILENLENNEFSRSWKYPWILQNYEMSWKNIACDKIHLEQKKPVNKYYPCRRKSFGT